MGSRFKIGVKWRIVAATSIVGLLLSAALAFTVHKHGESVRANAQAARDRRDASAAERAVSAFWQQREVMGEILVFPSQTLSEELHVKRLRFEDAMGGIMAESPAEQSAIDQARAANDNLVIVFDDQPDLSSGGGADTADGARLHAAERAVLTPIRELLARNLANNLRGESIADSAERAAFHSEVGTAGFGLAVVALFALFAVGQVRRIDDQNDELQAADTAKDDFISTVSHELRTPLTSMEGYVELLLEGTDPLTEEQRSFLGAVRRGSTRLERLINDLLLTAQVRAGHLDVQKTSTDLVEIARQAVAAAQAHAGQSGLELNLTVPAHAIEVEADAVRIGQAIDNLISNAIKFTPESGRVDVTLAESGDRVTLEVADTGMGMTADDIERLYQRFFRTDAAQAQQIQGTGLGLPIVKAIVEAHDGTITVTSEPDVGTSFVVSLPVAAALDRRPAAGRPAPLATAELH